MWRSAKEKYLVRSREQGMVGSCCKGVVVRGELLLEEGVVVGNLEREREG